MLKKVFNEGESNHNQSYAFRALASHPDMSKEAILYWQNHDQLTPDRLITIAARNWTVLEDEQLQALYLEALSYHDQAFFNQLFIELVAIPTLRPLLLAQLRNPNRSQQLTQAIGGLFKATK